MPAQDGIRTKDQHRLYLCAEVARGSLQTGNQDSEQHLQAEKNALADGLYAAARALAGVTTKSGYLFEFQATGGER